MSGAPLRGPLSSLLEIRLRAQIAQETARPETMTGRTQPDGAEVEETAAARLAAAREEYAQLARRGRAGREAASRYAYHMDGVVQSIVASARDRSTTPFVVCAVGGYGRR